jgi:hypothetical protein
LRIHDNIQQKHKYKFLTGRNTFILGENSGDGEEDVRVWYIHSKGVSSRHIGNLPVLKNIDSWRRLMETAVVWNWKTCAQIIGSDDEYYDACGIIYEEHINGPAGKPIPFLGRFFSGNFWWSHSKYISKLSIIDMNAYYIAPEMWICSGNGKFYEFFRSNNSLYDTHFYPIPPLHQFNLPSANWINTQPKSNATSPPPNYTLIIGRKVNYRKNPKPTSINSTNNTTILNIIGDVMGGESSGVLGGDPGDVRYFEWCYDVYRYLEVNLDKKLFKMMKYLSIDQIMDALYHLYINSCYYLKHKTHLIAELYISIHRFIYVSKSKPILDDNAINNSISKYPDLQNFYHIYTKTKPTGKCEIDNYLDYKEYSIENVVKYLEDNGYMYSVGNYFDPRKVNIITEEISKTLNHSEYPVNTIIFTDKDDNSKPAKLSVLYTRKDLLFNGLDITQEFGRLFMNGNIINIPQSANFNQLFTDKYQGHHKHIVIKFSSSKPLQKIYTINEIRPAPIHIIL